MLYFNLESIKPGMTLGKDLQDSKTNMTLLRKGTVLSESHVNRNGCEKSWIHWNIY